MNTNNLMITAPDPLHTKFARMLKKPLKTRGFRSYKNALMLLATVPNVLIAPYAHAVDPYALPSGGVVVGGNASFNYGAPNELHVQQNSDRAIINWNSFNIGKDATTQFHQPNANSLVVNRVTGSQDPTRIFGTLKANGNVMVLDRNGVIFGRDSVIDVGGIIASTGSINDHEVMSGKGFLTLDDVASGGAIINEGTITVSNAGLAAFVAPSITNSGLIHAKLGRVALAAGDKATVDLYGDGLVELTIDKPVDHASVTNSGVIEAESGTILVTAAAAKNVVDNMINMSGVIKASSVKQEGGTIILEGGNINVSGTMDASGKDGGGKILVGGDYKGTGKIKHSQKTVIEKNAVIKANATETGKGGTAIIWSDVESNVAGIVEAKGVSEGGFIETSSAGKLTVDGETVIDVSATVGKGGEWLIDPQDILIGNTWGDIQAGTINAALNAGSNVTITTNSGLAGGGDITLDYANITKSTSNNDVTFRLEADRNIIASNSIIRTTSGDKLNVIFQADRFGNHDGNISSYSTNISTNGGDVIFGGGPDLATGFAYGNHSSDRTGIVFVNGIIDAGTGSITMRGHGLNDGSTGGNGGIAIYDDSVLKTSGSGTINLYGIGGTAANFSIGVELANRSSIETQNGNISIYGQAGASNIASGAMGMSVFSSSSVKSTAGNIDITAIAGHSGMEDLYVNTGSNVIGGATMTGDITLNINSADISALNAQTTRNILIKPRTASRNIILGQNGAAGNLVLNNAALATFNAGTLAFGDGSSDILVDGWNLSGKSHNVYISGREITVGELTLGAGDVSLLAMNAGNFSVVKDSSYSGNGALNLLSTGDVNIDGKILNSGTGAINIFAGWNGSSGLTASYVPDISSIAFGPIARNIVLGANSQLSSGATGTAILAATTGEFTNLSSLSSSAIVTSAGRYLVYNATEKDQTKGGLTAQSLYNKTYNSLPPASITGSSKFIFLQNSPDVDYGSPSTTPKVSPVKQAQDLTSTPHGKIDDTKSSGKEQSGCLAILSTSGTCFISL